MKLARTGFICVFAVLFAFIAMMGEGLHFLPGLGHYGDSLCECHFSCRSAAGRDCCPAGHSPAVSASLGNSHDIHNTTDCPVCQYFSQAKPPLVILNLVADSLLVAERIEIPVSFLQSRCEPAYQPRAPPS